MAYNMTWMNSTTSIGGIVINVNTMMNELFFVFLLIVITFALLRYVKDDGVDGGIVVMFAVSIIASLAWIAGFVGWYIVMIPIIMFLMLLGIKFFGD